MELREFEIKQRDARAHRAVEKYGNTLWHYTDVVGLNGMLNIKEIWFGSAANMNDSEELNGFIWDLEREVLKEVTVEKIPKAKSVFENIKNRLKLEYPFIFCVSRPVMTQRNGSDMPIMDKVLRLYLIQNCCIN